MSSNFGLNEETMDPSRILLAVIQLCNIVLLTININIFQINGKRGFANRRHLQETRVYQRNEQVLYAAPPEAQYYEAQLGGPGKGVKKMLCPMSKLCQNIGMHFIIQIYFLYQNCINIILCNVKLIYFAQFKARIIFQFLSESKIVRFRYMI